MTEVDADVLIAPNMVYHITKSRHTVIYSRYYCPSLVREDSKALRLFPWRHRPEHVGEAVSGDAQVIKSLKPVVSYDVNPIMMSHGHHDIFGQKTGADGEKAVPTTWARGGGGLLTHKPSQGTLLTLIDESKEEEVQRIPDQIKGVDNLSYPQLDPKWGPGGT